MNFKELLKSYKARTASDAEIKIVEDEIEKNKLINEYLAESMDDLFLEDETFSIDLKEDVSNRLRKNILYSVLLVFALYIMMNSIISPMIDAMYYNPSKLSYNTLREDLDFDMMALTELTVPGYEINGSFVEKNGFGDYELTIRRTNAFGKNEERIPIRLTRNKRDGFFDYLFSYDIWPTHVSEERMAFEYEDPMSDLKSMKGYASVFITLEGTLPLIDVARYELDYDQLVFQWFSIENGRDTNFERIGFQPFQSKRISFSAEPDRELYPLFYLSQMNEFGISANAPYEEHLADSYEVHLKTLLKYMIDRKEFVEVMDKNSLMIDVYEDSLTYIDENGISVDGLLVFGEPKELVEFIEKNNVYGVQILDVKASEYSRK